MATRFILKTTAAVAMAASLFVAPEAEAQGRADFWSDLSPQRFYTEVGAPEIIVQNNVNGALYMWNGDWSGGVISDAGDSYASSIRYSRTAGIALAYQGFAPFHQAEVPPGIYTHMQKGSFSVSTDAAVAGLTKLILRVDVEGAGQFALASEYATLTSLSAGLSGVAATLVNPGAALPEIVGGGHHVWEFEWDLAELSLTGPLEDFSIDWTLNQNNYTYGVEVVQVIPEPGSIALLILAGAGLLTTRRARRSNITSTIALH